MEVVNRQDVTADASSYRRMTWFLALVTVGLVAAAVTLRNYHFALGALLPALVLVGVAVGRPRSCRVTFGESALVCEEPPLELPYNQICGLTVHSLPYLADQAPRGGIVRVMTHTRILELGGRLNLFRGQLMHRLLDRIPRGGELPDQPMLDNFARSEREQFGDERVWTFRAIEHCRESLLGYGIVGWGLLLLTAVWLVAAFENPGWAAGVISALLGAGLIAVLASRGKMHQRMAGKHWQESGLVISPTALAMIQGDLQGKARWSEIKSVKYVRQRMVVEVAGASFFIADIYDRPIQQIHELVRLYTSGDDMPAPVPSRLPPR